MLPMDPRNESVDGETSLAAYNVLRSRVDDAAKHARTLFISHLAVSVYGLLTVATLPDSKFFEYGAAVKLPIIDLEVQTILYLPGISILAIIVFLYFQVYLHQMWLLDARAEAASRVHADAEGFVPHTLLLKFPWIAFIARGNDLWGKLAAIGFRTVQEPLLSALLAACWVKAVRVNSPAWP
jgi:hypothetical protein